MNKNNHLVTQNSERDLRFDILKTLGICLVILAHVIPHRSILFQLRNFDVPMMIIVSGILFDSSVSQKRYSYWQYLQRRIPRLVAPVWFFLLVFFIIVGAVSFFSEQPHPFSLQVIISSFFLTDGITYLWIIRVFTLIAIVSPILVGMRNRFSRNSFFLTGLGIIYLGYELLLHLMVSNLSKLQIDNWLGDLVVNRLLVFYLLTNILFYVIPYGCVFGIGLVIEKTSRLKVFLLASFFLVIFLIIAIYYAQEAGEFVPTQAYKVLPQLYYLSYGIGISLLFYLGVDKLYTNLYFFFKDNSLLVKVIVFLSSSSLWIFLWHILALQYLDIWVTLFPDLRHYLIKYVVVLTFSSLVVWLQKLLISKLITISKLDKRQRDWLIILFLK